MLTEYEAQKIRTQMYEELNAGPRAAWQCAAGLILVIGLALAGILHDPVRNRSSEIAQVQEPGQVSSSTADDFDAQTYVRPETPAPADAKRNLIPVVNSVPHEPSTSNDLEKAFWLCDYAATTRSVDTSTAIACSTITDELKVRKFSGDFDAMLAWWRKNKPAEHQALEAANRERAGMGAAAITAR